MGMEGYDHKGGSGVGEGGWHILKTTHSVCILTFKAVTIKTVDSQAHFSGDPKSYAQKYLYLKKYSPF